MDDCSTVQRESFVGESFANFAVLEQFAKALTAKFSLSTGTSLSMSVCFFLTKGNATALGSWMSPPSRSKSSIVHQQLPKLPRRHGSLNQQLPLRSSLILFVLLQSCLSFPAHAFLSFPTIHESFNCENPTFGQLRKFSAVKDFCYMVS